MALSPLAFHWYYQYYVWPYQDYTGLQRKVMPAVRPLPTTIGLTENALRTLLTKVLSTTRIRTYRGWVVLNASSNSGATTSNGNWQLAAADALKVGPDEVEEVLAELRAAGLVNDNGSLTALGAADLARGRSAVSAMTSRLLDGIGAEEQVAARLVLDHIRQEAEKLLRA